VDTHLLEGSSAIAPQVPIQLVRDFNHLAIPPVDGDLHLGWQRLHDGPEIFYTPRNGDHWVFTRAADIKETFGNIDFFLSTGQNSIPRQQPDILFSPAGSDPPELGDVRKLLLPRFKPAIIMAIEQASRYLSVSLINGMKPQGGCEFVNDFSRHMPIRICLTLMFAGLNTVVSAMSFFMGFLATHLEQRRRPVETPELVPNAVEELLRYNGVINMTAAPRRIRFTREWK
jgi:cytochrome P450